MLCYGKNISLIINKIESLNTDKPTILIIIMNNMHNYEYYKNMFLLTFSISVYN